METLPAFPSIRRREEMSLLALFLLPVSQDSTKPLARVPYPCPQCYAAALQAWERARTHLRQGYGGQACLGG